MVALVTLGCAQDPVPVVPPAVPFQKPVAVPRPPVEPTPKEPEGPAGLERARVGDRLEFRWSRTEKPAATAVGPGEDPMLRKMRVPARFRGSTPVPPVVQNEVRKGTLAVTRLASETPFTFLVEVQSEDESVRKVFEYSADVPLKQVLFRTSVDAEKKDVVVQGERFNCVTAANRLVDPAAEKLAMSGGVVSQTAEDSNVPGSVSLTLTKISTTKALAYTETPRKVDSFETPLDVAVQQVHDFATAADDSRQRAAQTVVGQAARTCLPKTKERGSLSVAIQSRKVLSIDWAGRPASKPFDACLREKLKNMKVADRPFNISMFFQ